jgi:quercetin dioxygenase-like cupin family protein
MGAIFHVDEKDISWAEFRDGPDAQTSPAIRFKSLNARRTDVPPMQYVEYPPGYEDPVHRHETGEVLIVTAGEFHLDGITSAAGAAVYVPRDTDYSLRSGDEGVRFFRIVVP